MVDVSYTFLISGAKADQGHSKSYFLGLFSLLSLPGYRIALSKRSMYVCAHPAHDMLHEAFRHYLPRLTEVRSVVRVARDDSFPLGHCTRMYDLVTMFKAVYDAASPDSLHSCAA